MQASFRDKIAIVTGGASGIGREICRELGHRGAVVTVADINAEGAEQVASAITAAGGRARATRADVTQAEDIQRTIEETVPEHGRLDYMFNNAGIAISGEVRDMTLEHWRRIVDINLWGVIFGTTIAYSLMVKQGFGHIVNIASTAGLIGFPTGIAYATTKSAVVGLSTSLRAEGADLGVKVSVVCPGFVETGIFEAATVLNTDREALLSKPLPKMDAAKAARSIMHGVERNRQIITFPLHARVLWWLYRLHPSILTPLLRKMVRDFRAMRFES